MVSNLNFDMVRLVIISRSIVQNNSYSSYNVSTVDPRLSELQCVSGNSKVFR